MAEYLVEQFILHSTPYRETSALVTAFSRELGKVKFVAKGVTSKNNKLKGLTQPFTLQSAKLFGRGDLKTGVSLEMLKTSLFLAGKQLYCGMYCNEVLMRILPLEEPQPTLFDFYYETLKYLQSDHAPEPVLRSFELYILGLFGYEYDFAHDFVNQQPVHSSAVYQFVQEQGFRQTINGTGYSLFKGAHLLDIASQNWHSGSLNAAKQFTRQALLPLLGTKPLKSRELFSVPHNP